MSTEVSSLADLSGDLAGTYRRTESSGATVDPAIVDADLATMTRDGYVILPDLLSATQLDEIRAAVTPMLDRHGRNGFEGRSTQRIYSVLNKTAACDVIADHPRVLALLDRMFLPNYLLSMLQVINILPGEQAQMLHTDDGFYPLPRPRAALGAATIWAIDDFTADNGATDVVPGSQLWGDRLPGDDVERKPVVMSAGSCVFFPGTLWHGGGANRTDRPRLAVTAQYCEPWLRPQEAFTLSMTRDTVRRVSEDIRRMLGYSIHPPFIGQVDGMHPKRLLDIAGDQADQYGTSVAPADVSFSS
ncbi:phytanoyl-CoA dioxygenase family protein [Mycobacterium sp. SMC-21]|uniref:phytanoyl-CoA dioxygenase family protein n=1 Tax=Mycobacterium sp. SMC-21 TaxID=3381632 RepID=UPI003877563C